MKLWILVSKEKADGRNEPNQMKQWISQIEYGDENPSSERKRSFILGFLFGAEKMEMPERSNHLNIKVVMAGN